MYHIDWIWKYHQVKNYSFRLIIFFDASIKNNTLIKL